MAQAVATSGAVGRALVAEAGWAQEMEAADEAVEVMEEDVVVAKMAAATVAGTVVMGVVVKAAAWVVAATEVAMAEEGPEEGSLVVAVMAEAESAAEVTARERVAGVQLAVGLLEAATVAAAKASETEMAEGTAEA